MEISQIVSTRKFGEYEDDDLEAMIARCDGCSLGGDPLMVRQARINIENLRRSLDQRRAEAERRLRDAAEAERHQQHTVLEKEKLGHLTEINGKVSEITDHVADLDDLVKGFDARLAKNEQHVKGIHTEAKRATMIGLAAVVLALIVPIWEHFGCRGQKETGAGHNTTQRQDTNSLSPNSRH